MSEETPKPKPRRFGFFLVFALLAAGGTAGFLWWRDGKGVTTDDAFLRADVVQVAAETGGKVVEVHVVENQHVQAGDLLLVLDSTDANLRIAQAEANLAAAEADAKRADDAAAVNRSDIKTGEARLADAQRELKLQEQLTDGGASVRAAVDRARAAAQIASQSVQTARSGLIAAQAAADAARARIPAAQAAVDMARRELSLTEVRAPYPGVASKMDLQPGELVQRGQAVLALVPDERYIVANFKETDLARIHVGDPVDIEVDAFPEAKLHGKVQSIGAGTGAMFSLMPADNASGNFIKVVQRIPVRVALDEVPTYPAGLSVLVTVNDTQSAP